MRDLRQKYEGRELSNFQTDFPADLQMIFRNWQLKLRAYSEGIGSAEEAKMSKSVLDWLTGTIIPKWSMQFDEGISEREHSRGLQQ